MDLSEFLLARVAEDEAVARGASHQKVAGPFHGNWRPDSALLMANGALEAADRAHIARHDPARVLAECEAKRRIVERCKSALENNYQSPDDPEWVYEFTENHMWNTLYDLAQPYASHADFDPAWRIS